MFDGPATGDTVSLRLGTNTIGEACRLTSAQTARSKPEQITAFQLKCGKWKEPSANIVRMSNNSASTPELAAKSWWREDLNESLNCGEAVATEILDGVSGTALDCSLRAGGWPYQALVVRIGQDIYFADSIPVAYPAVEQAIGVLSGRVSQTEAPESTGASREIERLEARLASATYSAGDLERYQALLRLAQYYNFEDNFPEAETRYRQALALQQNVVSGQADASGFLYMHIGLELSNQERFYEADAFFDKSEALLGSSNEPADESRLISYRAIHKANQQKIDEALALARQATRKRRELARQSGQELQADGFAATAMASADFSRFFTFAAPSSVMVGGRGATTLGDMVQSRYIEAAMLIQQGKTAEAAEALDEALVILEAEQRVPRRWVPQVRFLQGRIAELNGDLNQAEQLLLAAIDDQRALYSNSRTEGRAYVALGRIYTAQSRNEDALNAYRRGFGIIAEQGGEVTLDAALPYFRAGLTKAAATPDDRQTILAEMFKVGQMIRGPVTAQSMALTAARLAAGDADVAGVIRSLQDARRQRDDLGRTLTVAQADPRLLPPQLVELEAQLDQMGRRVASLERQVQAAAPRYNQLIDTPVSADAIRGVLLPDEAVVQVLVGAQGSFGFLIDTDGIAAYEIDLSEADVKHRVSIVRKGVDVSNGLRDFPVKAAHELYVHLFAPVDERLGRARHVITIPSGALLSLPFGVLVSQAPSTANDYSQVAWLARHHAMTLAPSAQSFLNLRNTVEPSNASQPFIGFGDFVPHGDATAVLETFALPEACREDAMLLSQLSALPNTAGELRTVADLVSEGAPPTLFLNTAFTEASVKETNLADYRIVYFATHGLLPYSLQCLREPALVLSKAGQSDADDGLLGPSEVVQLELDADLVVLSACDTGGPGSETGGESLSGLARAFFFAGARSLLVTHWEIPDQETVDLLTEAFSDLANKDATVAEAFRASQVDLIRQKATAHPFFWGAFTVVGDGGQRLTRSYRAPLQTREPL